MAARQRSRRDAPRTDTSSYIVHDGTAYCIRIIRHGKP